MDNNKVKVQLKPGIDGAGRVHTQGFDLVLEQGETAEVTEEQYQRHLFNTGLFEVAGVTGQQDSAIDD